MDASAATDVLVIGAFVSVLEPTPAADVVYQHHLEVGGTGLHVLNQLLQRQPPANVQATFAFVGIGPHDLDAALSSVLADLVGLVFGRVLLVLGRHPDVFGSPEQGRLVWLSTL